MSRLRHLTTDILQSESRIHHSSLVTWHSPFVTRHSSLVTPLSAFCIAAFAAASAFADLDFGAFAHRATIDFAGYEGDSTLTNFPALVRLEEGTGGFSVSDCALPGGQDVRFSLGNGVELPSKVVAWDDHGTNEFYVLVPRLTSATRILMFWGNAAAEARDPFATPFATDDYVLSWSFEEEGKIAIDDSLSSSWGVKANDPAQTRGVAGKALSFTAASSQYVRLAAGSYPVVNSRHTFTYEGWAKWPAVPSASTGIFGLSLEAWHSGSFVALANTGKIIMKDGIQPAANHSEATTSAAPAVDTWHHLMMARDDATGVAKLFIDGDHVLTASCSYLRPVMTMANSGAISQCDYSFGAGLGRCTGYRNAFDGLVDELRVSPVCRGQDYAAAVFKNVTDPAHFMTITDASSDPYVETIGLAAPETVSVTVSAGAGGSVSPALAGASYAKGATIQITATPADNTKAFYAWEGNCPTLQVFSASIALPADRDRSVTAVFGRAWHVSAANGNDATADGTISHPFASIEAAVAAVNAAGDWPSVILVGDGQYTLTYANPIAKAVVKYENSMTGYAMALTNRVALRSVNGPSATGINCAKKGGYGGLLLSSMGAVVDGFTITNALANGWHYRGALALVSQGHLQNCFLGRALLDNRGSTSVKLEMGWIRGCVFTEALPNMTAASNYGGPLVASGGTVDSCVFSNNFHYLGINFGGVVVRNCLFADNDCSTKSDGTLGTGGGLYSSGGTVVENCTFMDNHAGLQGGGVYGGAVVVNCAFGGNAVTQSANGPDFYDAGLVNSLSAYATATDGNVVGTPTVADAANGDYAPKGVSATRDAGLGLRWLREPGRTDIVGNDRVVSVPDIGAFEYVPTGDDFDVSVSASAYTGTDTLTVTFTARVVGPENVTYAWDFGDGATSTEASPTHAYAAPGYYTVALTVTDAADATRTASFEGGEDLIKVMPSTCYVRKAGDSTPTAPYATPETAADNLFDASSLSPAKIDVGEGDILLGGPVAVSTAMEIRGRGPGVTRLNASGKYIFLNHAGAVLADLTLRNRPGGNWNSGILMFGADALATNCVVREASGNSVALVGMTSGRLVECVVTGGESRNGGNGGIIILSDMTDNSTPQPISKRGGVVIDRCVVSNCTANYTGAVGGTGIRVLANHTPKPVIRNTLVAFNYAKTTGDGTANYGAGISFSQPGIIENCTIVSNAFNKGDYAVGLYASVVVDVTNTVVWGNYAGETRRDVGGVAGTAFSHCLAPEFATGVAASWTLDACLSVDPRFRDFDGGDWTSAAGSPLRNSGVALPWMGGATDLLGNPRKVQKPDIGCYECPFRTSFTLHLR